MARTDTPVIRYANPNKGRLHFASAQGSKIIFVDRKRALVIERAVQHAIDLKREAPCKQQRSAKR